MSANVKAAAANNVSRECIECDNCNKPAPPRSCSRCHLAYYCNSDCQRAHWKKEHKSSCAALAIDVMRESNNPVLFRAKVPALSKPTDTCEGPCAICLADTVSNPVTLECKHVFCFSCIHEYQQSARKTSSTTVCPCCRMEMPDVRKKALERVNVYGERAIQLAEGTKERQTYLEYALADVDAVLESDEENLTALTLKAQLLGTVDPEEAVGIAWDAIAINETAQSFGEGWVLQLYLYMAEAHQAMGDWNKANIKYKMVYEKINSLPQSWLRNFYTGTLRQKYEMGEHDQNIRIGIPVIAMGRHYPGVHKYVALSQKAKGDITAAKRTMSRAIFHETPWDEENIERNVQILKEL